MRGLLLAMLMVLAVPQHHRKIFNPVLTFVQACTGNQSGLNTTWTINIGATGTCGVPQNPVAGDLVHVYVQARGTNITALSAADTLSNSWTCNHLADSEGDCYSKLTTGGAADTVTLTINSANGSAVSLEFSGLAGTIDAGASVNSISSSTSWTLPGVTTTNPSDIVIGCGGGNFNSPLSGVSPFTLPTNGSFRTATNTSSVACEYQIVNSTGTYTPQLTVGAANAGSGYTVAFK